VYGTSSSTNATPGSTDQIVNGPPIVQPSPGDGGVAPADQIGTIWNSVYDDTVDAAIAILDVAADASLRGLPTPPEIAGTAAKGMHSANRGARPA
jgi:hypothetical protein